MYYCKFYVLQCILYYCVRLCPTVYHSVLLHIIRHYGVLCYVNVKGSVLMFITLYYCVHYCVLFCFTLCCCALFSTTVYNSILLCVILHYCILFYGTLFSVAIYIILLWCIIERCYVCFCTMVHYNEPQFRLRRYYGILILALCYCILLCTTLYYSKLLCSMIY